MKTLALVTATSTKVEESELRKLERSDAHPRATLFGEALNADILDARLLAKLTDKRVPLYGKLPSPLRQIIEAFALRKEYDAIVSWAEHLGFPLACLLRLTGSDVPHVAIASWISKPKTAAVLKLGRSRIDRLILMSSVQYKFAIEKLHLPPSQVTLLKWPIDHLFWRPMPVQADMISTAGREMRDFKTFIEAMSGLNLRCHIAAATEQGKKDPWIRDIEKFDATGSSITVGRKTLQELREIYARSWFVVVPLFPTDTDNGTTTILEAMAMGKAVICSRVVGQADVIQEGKTGIFVPPRDPRALREAIQHLTDHPEIAGAMGKEGRCHIEKHHTVDAWVAQVKSIVETSIAAHNGINRTQHS